MNPPMDSSSAVQGVADAMSLADHRRHSLRGCGFFTVRHSRIAFQRGYWDKLSFLKLHGLTIE